MTVGDAGAPSWMYSVVVAHVVFAGVGKWSASRRHEVVGNPDPDLGWLQYEGPTLESEYALL